MGTKEAWTPERRVRQAEFIRRTKPWEQSTGPTSHDGKAISARNAYKGDIYHDACARLAKLDESILALVGLSRTRGGGPAS